MTGEKQRGKEKESNLTGLKNLFYMSFHPRKRKDMFGTKNQSQVNNFSTTELYDGRKVTSSYQTFAASVQDVKFYPLCLAHPHPAF